MKRSDNIVNKWLDLSSGAIGGDCRRRRQNRLDEILIDSSFLPNMATTHSYEHVFSKMLSALEWHPKSNHLLIGSRGGDVSCVDVMSRSVRQCTRGRGRGQQITDIKFDVLDTNWFYTSSTSGKLIKQRLDGREDIILSDSHDSDVFMSSARFSCLDVSPEHRLVAAGDSKGHIHLTPSCESAKTGSGHSVQIHSSNVLHIEFNRFNANLLMTASIDCTAKLWDVRMIGETACKPVLAIRQSHPLNSATFSLTNGSTLLVTNYCDEIGVYRAPDWQLERCIRHGHEQTQRFCLLKARWHPLCDIFAIGSHCSTIGTNYERPQPIDVIDVKTGHVVARVSDGSAGVLSIACFNSTGDTIAAIRGQNLIMFESMAKDF